MYSPLEPLHGEGDEEKLFFQPGIIINSMSSLRHLEELYFYSKDRVDDLVPSLVYGKKNDNLRVVRLPGSSSSTFVCAVLIEPGPVISRLKLTIYSILYLNWGFGLDGEQVFLRILLLMKMLLNLELTLRTADVYNSVGVQLATWTCPNASDRLQKF